MFHFFLCVRRGRYSAIHRFQNTDNMLFINFHFTRKLLTLSCGIEMLTFGLLLPNRKWLGAKASISFTLPLIGTSGLLLMRDSISIKYVTNISSVNNESRTTVFSAFFVIITIACVAPFIYGEAGGLKFLSGSRFAASSL